MVTHFEHRNKAVEELVGLVDLRNNLFDGLQELVDNRIEQTTDFSKPLFTESEQETFRDLRFLQTKMDGLFRIIIADTMLLQLEQGKLCDLDEIIKTIFSRFNLSQDEWIECLYFIDVAVNLPPKELEKCKQKKSWWQRLKELV